MFDVAFVDKVKRKIPKKGLQRTVPRDEQKCIPVCHTFYMSYDKHIKRMTSKVLLFLTTTLLDTTMNQYDSISLNCQVFNHI